MNLFNNIFLLVLLLSLPLSVHSRPEHIQADVSYYSNDYIQLGMVRDIEVEKNYEEIYQFYNYYEVIYDSLERVKIFREYKRGDVIHEEHYRYDQDSVKRTVVP